MRKEVEFVPAKVNRNKLSKSKKSVTLSNYWSNCKTTSSKTISSNSKVTVSSRNNISDIMLYLII